MNPPVISRAILTRLQADTGTGGLYHGSVWNTITSANYNLGAPATSFNPPYLVWAIRMECAHLDGAMGAKARVTFRVVDNSTSANANIEAVFDRLIGDAVLSSGTWGVPTYGFHNHKLVLPTNTLGALASEMNYLDAEIAPDDQNYLIGTMTFDVNTTAAAVNQ